MCSTCHPLPVMEVSLHLLGWISPINEAVGELMNLQWQHDDGTSKPIESVTFPKTSRRWLSAAVIQSRGNGGSFVLCVSWFKKPWFMNDLPYRVYISGVLKLTKELEIICVSGSGFKTSKKYNFFRWSPMGLCVKNCSSLHISTFATLHWTIFSTQTLKFEGFETGFRGSSIWRR